jgi:hypothetical protein
MESLLHIELSVFCVLCYAESINYYLGGKNFEML